LFFVSVISCNITTPEKASSLDRIRERGRIVMITQNSGNTYYIYRDQPLGFEYELAAAFADHIGVDLVVLTPGWMEMFDKLVQGRGDFVAAGVAVSPFRERRMDFSDPYLTVRQEVIVRHDSSEIKTARDLDGKTVHVRAGTTFQETLAGLLGEGIKMELVLVPDVSNDELIRQVADGEIDATVAYSNVALGSRIYHPDINTAFAISPPQSLAWAVRKGDRDLLEAINDFLTMVKIDGTLDDIIMRYFGDRDHLNTFDLKAFHRGIELYLPQYRGMIREAARDYGFDWRLIAAMMYQESQFDPDARSHTGVRGLMQVTQRTAEEMGIEDRMDPEQSIRAGVGYLASLYDWFDDIEDEENRLRFALASYNVGYGHVRDAQDILRERGDDTQSWSSLRESLPLLRMPEFYRETRFGYARGTEPVRYVENVLTYYDILKKKI
jgi:membrane-bound lytic murein transglycosylase F